MDRIIEAIIKEVEEIIQIIVETILEATISEALIIITEVASIREVDSEEATTDIRTTRRDGSSSLTTSKTTLHLL